MKLSLRTATCCLVGALALTTTLNASTIRLKDLAADKKVTAINRVMEVSENALYLKPAPGGGVVWIPDVEFSEGTITVELRGRDNPGQSFLGIAFHAADAEHFDSIYLRPFNFRIEDPMRRKRAIQYISIPGSDWPDLREKFPGKYEGALSPAPAAEEWCRLRVVVKGKELEAFVNDAPEPALRVTLLNERLLGKVGLWVGNNSDGWFKTISVQAAGSDKKAVSANADWCASIPEWMREFKVPVAAIAVIEGGRLQSAEVFHINKTNARPGRPTHFNIASLTKPVFAMMALQLAGAGVMPLDESLARHWIDPDVQADSRHRLLTPAICLSHKTGLPNWRGDESLAFAFTPGEKTRYSGEGFEYLRRAIERKTGRTIEDLATEHVFKRAGMANSFFTWRHEIDDTWPGAFDADGKRYPDEKHTEPSAADGLLTTIEDYARFVEWVLRGDGYPKQFRQALMESRGTPGEEGEFRLGWNFTDDPRVLSHGGNDRGSNTEAVLWPAKKNAVIVLTPSDNGDVLIRRLFGKISNETRAYVRTKDLSNWRFITQMPPGEFGVNRSLISQSPAIMDKLLHSVLTRFEDAAGLSEKEKSDARDNCDKFIRAFCHSRSDTVARANRVVAAFENPGSPATLKTNFTTADLRHLIKLLN